MSDFWILSCLQNPCDLRFDFGGGGRGGGVCRPVGCAFDGSSDPWFRIQTWPAPISIPRRNFYPAIRRSSGWECELLTDKSLARPDRKNNWKVAIFLPTRRSLLPRRPGWTDSLLNCFWVACKSLSLVAVACFLPGRARDFSAPRVGYEYSFDFS